MGVVVWNHGRSIKIEDSASPTPPYLRVLPDAGWDILRLNRPRDGDTLTASTRRLVDQVGQLRQKGYRRIALAGQSFGAFLALMAADSSDDVDAVVATSPAAFGSFEEFYDSWSQNATRLYPLLERIKRARVMLFYFHGDDFDPGGRGERSRAILSARPIGFTVVDQPAFLSGHWASSTGLFLRRFGACIRDFIDADKLEGERGCEPSWGETPSVELRLPDELVHPPAAMHAAVAGTGASAPTAASAASAPSGDRRGRQSWYGFTRTAAKFFSPSKLPQGTTLTRSTLSGLGSMRTSRPSGAVAKGTSSMTNSSLRNKARARFAFGRVPMAG